MQIIKFRQPLFNRDNSFNSWHYWGWISEGVFIAPLSIGHNVHGVFGLQFTGLHDSKGIEIYEGDIVDGIIIDGEAYPMGEVFFDSGCFCIKTKSDSHDFEPCLYEAWREKIVIIGNIYKTPELLKGKKYGRRK